MLFAAVSDTRRRLYKSGVFRRVRIAAPVIVIGNITVGGTGKTPLVIALIEALRERGWHPGVITRGFGGSASDVERVDGNSDVRVVGDEAKLIFESTGAPVMVGRDRVRAAQDLIDSAQVNLVISDDGLQHYRLHRDIEICVIDGQRRFGNGRLLPAGPLREPITRLASVDFRVCNGADAQSSEIPMRLRGDAAIAIHDPAHVSPLAAFAGRRAHAVAGTGNPDRFFAQLRSAGIDVIAHPFPDHHAFTASDLTFDEAAPILMTEKDAVKCRAFGVPDAWSVPVRADLPAYFYDAIQTTLRTGKGGASK